MKLVVLDGAQALKYGVVVLARFLAGPALVDFDKLTQAVPQDDGTRLLLGAQHLDVPLTLERLENVLAGREPEDGDEGGGAGFHTR